MRVVIEVEAWKELLEEMFAVGRVSSVASRYFEYF
jgi:hypothetical protein